MEYNAFTDSFDGPSTASNLTPDNARNGSAPSYQVGRGGTEITFTRDEATGQTTGTTRNSSGVEVRGDDLARGEGVERTIRTNSGWPVMGREYRGDDTIEVQG